MYCESCRIRYCEFCRTHWTRSDGGCECMFCSVCNTRTHEDFLDGDGRCEKCVNTSCDYCGDARGAVKVTDIIAGRKMKFEYCPVCYGHWLKGE
jgi:hypothetical protein